MLDDLIFFKRKTTSKKIIKTAILPNSTAQHMQPDQHNNQKYIGTIKKININWLWHNSKLT